jgi:3-oxoacyl-[acyl-carrier-protein] synthase-3
MKLHIRPGAPIRLMATSVARPMDLVPRGTLGRVLSQEDVMAHVLGPQWADVMAQRQAQAAAKAQASGQADGGTASLPTVANRQWLMGDATALDLGLEAARRALQVAGLAVQDLAALICVTSTPPLVSASMAARMGRVLAQEAGVPEGLAGGLSLPACLDVRAGGVGVMQAWFSAQGLIAQGAGPVLIVAAEAASHFMRDGDLGTALLYTDGAGACILGPSPDGSNAFLGGLSGQTRLPGQPTTIPGLLPPQGATPEDLQAYRFQRPDRTHLGALLELWSRFPPELVAAFPQAAAGLKHFLPYAVTPRQMDVAMTALGDTRAQVFHELEQWGCAGAASPLTTLHGLLQSGCAAEGDVILLASAAGNGLWAGFFWRL